MRLWLKDSERKPDPTPVKTDDRRAFIVGILVWAAALVVLLVTGAGEPWWIWAAVAGLVVGGLGVVNVIRTGMAR